MQKENVQKAKAQFKEVDRILVTTEQLQFLLGDCGRRLAQGIGKMAGAEVRIGSRLFYSVDKIKQFVEVEEQ